MVNLLASRQVLVHTLFPTARFEYINQLYTKHRNITVDSITCILAVNSCDSNAIEIDSNSIIVDIALDWHKPIRGLQTY